MTNKQKILIIDDEADIREILQFNLENEGYLVEQADSAEQALQKIRGQRFDLLLLDVMLGEMSGFQMAKTLKNRGNNIPIIFLTAKNTENDMLTGFSIGADDFITKPFSVKEVIARVKTVLKRSQTATPAERETPKFVMKNLVIDFDRKILFIDNQEVILTKKEFEILTLLVKNESKIFSRADILNRVWENEVVLERTVDVHIARLRKKLDKYGGNLINRSGYGYSFVREE
ncbi:MAG: response regulator transcription factor [Flavobacteriaceae bacterium]|jgi:DNA-binding response OmpR family regulator|nr:response regulator transcription factor [Flavobacteriaceae bacterium]